MVWCLVLLPMSRVLFDSFKISSNAVALATQCSLWNTVFSQLARNGPKLHRFGNDAAINASNRIMGCHQMPLPWRQIIRHQVSSKVCSSIILLLFQAFLLYFLHSSHIQAPSVSFQSKVFTFFLHITFQHSSLVSAFHHKAFPLAISSRIAFSSCLLLLSSLPSWFRLESFCFVVL